MMKRQDCRTGVVPGGLYYHPNAYDVGGCAMGCCDDYVCPDCGTWFRVGAAD